MAYAKQTWVDSAAGGTPISAARLNNIENGLEATDRRMASGTISIIPVANTPTTGTITFPQAFASAPFVVVTANTTVPGTQVTGVGVANTTTTGCTVYVTRINTTNTVINWVAILP